MVDRKKRCSQCNEQVNFEAKVCKYCAHRFTPNEMKAAADTAAQENKAGMVGCIILAAVLLLMATCVARDRGDPGGAGDTVAAEDRAAGFHCLSKWNGSNADLVAKVKAQLRDPGSFEHDETRIAPASADTENKHVVTMRYRARNGFGGMNVGTVTALVDPTTCNATLLSPVE